MLQQSAGVFKGFPCTSTQVTSRRGSSAHSHTLHTSCIITHWKFPIETEGNFFYHLQNGRFHCPQPNDLNLVTGKKAGETIFSTAYTLRSSHSAAVDHFWLHLLPLKQQIQRAKVSNATGARRFGIPLVTMQTTICSHPKCIFFVVSVQKPAYNFHSTLSHNLCYLLLWKGQIAASQKLHSFFIYIFDPVVFSFTKNIFFRGLKNTWEIYTSCRGACLWLH